MFYFISYKQWFKKKNNYLTIPKFLTFSGKCFKHFFCKFCWKLNLHILAIVDALDRKENRQSLNITMILLLLTRVSISYSANICIYGFYVNICSNLIEPKNWKIEMKIKSQFHVNAFSRIQQKAKQKNNHIFNIIAEYNKTFKKGNH